MSTYTATRTVSDSKITSKFLSVKMKATTKPKNAIAPLTF